MNDRPPVISQPPERYPVPFMMTAAGGSLYEEPDRPLKGAHFVCAHKRFKKTYDTRYGSFVICIGRMSDSGGFFLKHSYLKQKLIALVTAAVLVTGIIPDPFRNSGRTPVYHTAEAAQAEKTEDREEAGLPGVSGLPEDLSNNDAYRWLADYFLSEGFSEQEAAEWAELAVYNGFTGPEMKQIDGVYTGAAYRKASVLDFTPSMLLREAASRLGADYLYGYKGRYLAPCEAAPGSATPAGGTPACALHGAYDCAGYIFDVLRHFGLTLTSPYRNSGAAYLAEAATGLRWRITAGFPWQRRG